MSSAVPPLSPRLAAVADAIAPGARVADLGTDHGKLPLWLAANGRVALCVATEKNEALLARANRPPETAAWGARLAYRAGDGLEAVLASDRIDTVVVSGIGGRTIVRLLSAAAAPWPAISRLVLQPRSEEAALRRFLSERGWRPVRERLAVERGRFHVTVAAERGDDADLYRHDVLSREDLLAAGPLLVRSRSAEVTRFWRLQLDRLSTILGRKGAGAASPRLCSGILRCERILEVISTPGG